MARKDNLDGSVQTEYAGVVVDAGVQAYFGDKINFVPPNASSRLTNLNYGAQTWGKFIPITWGTARIEGSIVWATPFKESQVVKNWKRAVPSIDDEEKKAKFQVNLDYQYIATGAWSFGYNGSGSRRFLSRLYLNNTIVYDFAGGYRYPGLTFTFQEGTPDQMPAAPYIADKGDDAIAFRGQMVVFIENIPIKDFGSALPQVYAEIVQEDDIDLPGLEFDNSITPDEAGLKGQGNFVIDWVRRRAYQLIRDVTASGNIFAQNPGIAIYDIDSRTQIGEVPITAINDSNGSPIMMIPWMGIMFYQYSLSAATFIIDLNTGLELDFITELAEGVTMHATGHYEYCPDYDEGGAAWVASQEMFDYGKGIIVFRISEEGAYTGEYFIVPTTPGRVQGWMYGDDGYSYFFYTENTAEFNTQFIGQIDVQAQSYDAEWYAIPAELVEYYATRVIAWNGLLIIFLAHRVGTENLSVIQAIDLEKKTEVWSIVIPDKLPQFTNNMGLANLENGTIAWSSGSAATITYVLDLMSGTLATIPVRVDDYGIWDGASRSFFSSKAPAGHLFQDFPMAPPAGEISLESFMTDALLMAGFTHDQFAIQGVDDTIEGAFINQPYDVIQMLDDVSTLFRITRTETNGRIVYEKKVPDEGSVSPELTIDYKELAWINQSDDSRNALNMRMASGTDTPTEVTTQFINPELNYGDDTYTYRRPVRSKNSNAMSLRVPVMMSKSKVAILSQGILYDVWGGQLTGSLRLPRSFYDIDEGTIINLTHGSFSDIIKLTEVTHNADWSVSCSFEVVRSKRSASKIILDPYEPPITDPKGKPDSQLFLFDVPLLDPKDAKEGHIIIYMAIKGIGQPYWPGGYIANAELEAAYTSIARTKKEITAGQASNALGGSLSTVDGLRVFFGGKNPFEGKNATGAELSANPGRNLAFYGVNGRWEIIQWETATLDSKGFVIFTGVRRGLRGTSAGGHVVGDNFVTIDSNIQAVAFPISYIGTTQKFKPVGYGMPLAQAPVYEVVIDAAALRPFAPVVRRLADLDGGDIVVTWYRRDRLGFSTLGTADPLPQSDPPEEYDLELLADDNTVIRTVEGLTSPEWVYEEADQVTDGFSTTPQTIRVRVYQISTTIGRGNPGEDIVYVY